MKWKLTLSKHEQMQQYYFRQEPDRALRDWDFQEQSVF